MDKGFIVQTSTPERLYVKVYHDFLRSKLLSGKEQIVFIHLKQYIGIGNDIGTAYPTLTTLAENVKMTEKTVREILKKLQKIGILDIKRQGLNKPNIYTIKDSAEFWRTGTEEERQTGINNLDTEKKIADLEALGYKVIKPSQNEPSKSNNRIKKAKNSFNNIEKQSYNVDEIEQQILSN